MTTQTENDLLEAMDIDLELVCDYPECETLATHFLVCAECRASENMCDPHTVIAKLAPRDEYVVFDKSCNHRVLMADCAKIPIR